MTYQLNDAQRKWIAAQAKAFSGDLKYRIEGQQIIEYVDTYVGDQYRTVFAESETPDLILEAILTCPEYTQRSMCSGKAAILKALREIGQGTWQS